MSARGVPAGEPPEDPDLDAQWQDIVARLGDLDPGTEGTGPAHTGKGDGSAADPAPDGARAPERPPDADPTPRRRKDDVPGAHTVRPADPDASGPRNWAPDPAVEEAEDHFVPPDPGPVLGGDPLLVMAWVAVLAAPLLVLVAVIAWPTMPTWLLEVAGVAFLAGVGLLLWRMPHRRDPDDEDDNGAVV
ncbi:MAG: hypothetical protein KQH57_14645 [Actinomycetales bacterium]|nr:hypothetical protein [Actinomycetales bacterium]